MEGRCLCSLHVGASVIIALFLFPLKQTSVWPNWYGVPDDLSIEEPAPTPPPASSLSHLDMPPPYEAVSGGKPGEPSAIFFCSKMRVKGGEGSQSFRSHYSKVSSLAPNRSFLSVWESRKGAASATASCGRHV